MDRCNWHAPAADVGHSSRVLWRPQPGIQRALFLPTSQSASCTDGPGSRGWRLRSCTASAALLRDTSSSRGGYHSRCNGWSSRSRHRNGRGWRLAGRLGPGGRNVSVAAVSPKREGPKFDGLSSQEGKGEEVGDDDWLDSDWEEEDLDDLFEKYGETVISDPADTGAARDREANDDADSEKFALAIAAAANEVKGADILVLHVKPLVYWTCYFVIATAFSKPQIDAIGKRMRDVAEEGFQRKANGGDRQAPNAWTLLDYGDVVVHLFLPKERAFYNLEEFYGNAESLELPFESRTLS